jgi:hypothetical protein
MRVKTSHCIHMQQIVCARDARLTRAEEEDTAEAAPSASDSATAAAAAAAAAADHRRSIMRLHSIELQLIMQCLDVTSTVRLARCCRLLMHSAMEPFAWKHQLPHRLSTLPSRVIQHAGPLLERCRFDLTIADHADHSEQQMDSIGRVRIVSLTLTAQGTVAPCWLEVLSRPTMLDHLRSVHTHSVRSVPFLRVICEAPQLHDLTYNSVDRKSSELIGSFMSLRRFSLQYAAVITSLQPLFASLLLQASLEYFAFGFLHASSRPFAGDLSAMRALHTLHLRMCVAFDSTNADHTDAMIQEETEELASTLIAAPALQLLIVSDTRFHHQTNHNSRGIEFIALLDAWMHQLQTVQLRHQHARYAAQQSTIRRMREDIDRRHMRVQVEIEEINEDEFE